MRLDIEENTRRKQALVEPKNVLPTRFYQKSPEALCPEYQRFHIVFL